MARLVTTFSDVIGRGDALIQKTEGRITANRFFTTALVLFVILFPVLIDTRRWVHVMVLIGIYLIVTLGMSLLFGYTGQFSFAQAAFFGIGAFSSSTLTRIYDYPIWSGFLLGVVVAGMLAFVVGRPILRLTGFYLAMATLALSIIVFVLMKELEQFTGGPSGTAGIPFISIGGIQLDTPARYYVLAWAAALSTFFFSRNLINSRTGRAIRAIKDSETAAKVMGINTADYKAKIFAISAIFGALGGSLYAHYVGFVSPERFTAEASILIIIILAVGGVHSLWGALIGTILLIMLPEWLSGFAEYSRLIYGIIVIVLMMFAPAGIIGLLTDLHKLIKKHLSRLRATVPVSLEGDERVVP
jgi:branched-chain amino acid transport system permease protein